MTAACGVSNDPRLGQCRASPVWIPDLDSCRMLSDIRDGVDHGDLRDGAFLTSNIEICCSVLLPRVWLTCRTAPVLIAASRVWYR